MYSISFNNVPEYFNYIPWILVSLIFIIGLKRNRGLKKDEQKKGCGKILFSIIFVWSSSYFFFPLLISLCQTFYALAFYPTYDATITDSISRYHGTSNGRKQYLSHPIYEFSLDNSKVSVESNEATQADKIQIGSKTTISYKDGIIVNRSNWSLISYLGMLLLTILLGHGVVFSLFYGLDQDINYLKYRSIFISIYFYIPYVLLLLLAILFQFFYSYFK